MNKPETKIEKLEKFIEKYYGTMMLIFAVFELALLILILLKKG